MALVDDLERLGADPRRRSRGLVSLALAVAIVTVAIGVLRVRAPDTNESGPVQTVALERRPPTPRPTPPPPTPRPSLPPVARSTPAPVPQRAAPRAVKPSGGSHLAHHPPRPIVAPVALAPGHGSGTGSGDGSGAGNAGGSGNGTGGTGADAVNADTPCGVVEFKPIDLPRMENGTAYEHVRAYVHFADGHVETDLFPYPWVYPDAEQTDPWSKTNLAKPNLTVRAQLPPPGTNVRGYSNALRYILDHTTPEGTTVLQACPNR